MDLLLISVRQLFENIFRTAKRGKETVYAFYKSQKRKVTIVICNKDYNWPVQSSGEPEQIGTNIKTENFYGIAQHQRD